MVVTLASEVEGERAREEKVGRREEAAARVRAAMAAAEEEMVVVEMEAAMAVAVATVKEVGSVDGEAMVA